MLLLVFFLSGGDAIKNLFTLFISLILLAVTCILFEKRAPHRSNRCELAVLMSALSVIAISLYCASGFLFDSYRVVLLPSFIITHVLPIALICVFSELSRARMLALRKRALSVASCAVFVLMDAVLVSTAGDISSLGSSLLFAVFANFLYHYVALEHGALPNIPYKILMLTYPYFIPMKPLVPDALMALAQLMWPVVVFAVVRKAYGRGRTSITKKYSRWQNISFAAFVALCITAVLFVSSSFDHRLMVVGSGSMSGALETGDVIIYESFDGQAISRDDIILFERDGQVIIHRVIEAKRINSEMRYYTKGDANAAADVGYVTDEDIVGIKRIRVKYIGYPAIWIRSIAR